MKTHYICNGAIHILGGSVDSDTKQNHYKYDGSSWTSVSTLPYPFYQGSAVTWNDEIYILGGNNGSDAGRNLFYKYNNTSWSSVIGLPFPFFKGCAIVHENAIHVLGGYSSGTDHYKYDGNLTWRKASTLPYNFVYGSAVVYDNMINILGGNYNVLTYLNHYIIKNDNRHIATMLPKGAHIMLSDNEDINYVKNAEKVSSNIAEVTETGYVEVLATLPEINDIKGYLTFY